MYADRNTGSVPLSENYETGLMLAYSRTANADSQTGDSYRPPAEKMDGGSIRSYSRLVPLYRLYESNCRQNGNYGVQRKAPFSIQDVPKRMGNGHLN